MFGNGTKLVVIHFSMKNKWFNNCINEIKM